MRTAIILLLACVTPLPAAVRLKDIAAVNGVRDNQLFGYGLVVGLNGTGDSAAVTSQLTVNMLEKLGSSVKEADLNAKNVAAVAITATLPPFVKPGHKIDVLVSSIADAATLQGGVLLQTPLMGADRRVYAVAQGPISIGGFNYQGAAAKVQKNHATVGRIPNGAIVEEAVPMEVLSAGHIEILLRQPDSTTASRVADAINEQFEKAAYAEDPGTIRISVPDPFRDEKALIAFMAKVEAVLVEPDSAARVIINERTGTVVAGANVRLFEVALAHGGIVITTRETTQVSQPQAFGAGRTVATPETDIDVEEEGRHMHVIQQTATVADLARALNMLGITPRDMVAIFQALKRSGQLAGDLVIM